MTQSDVQNQRLKEICTQCGKSYAEGTRFCPADGTELMSTMADPLIGVTLPRRYRVQSLLGRGSMSVVYKGIYEPLDQAVAIKMLKSHLVSDPQQAKRFQQEIKTAGALNHPNIVGILDFGVTDQGVPYLIMEYLDGKSLSDIIEKEERISTNRGIKIFSQAADALAYAHHRGVVHRDIKPSNIVLIDTEDEKDIVKIVDFGIAKVVGRGAVSAGNPNNSLGLTAVGEVVGTPLYMSPEQANGRELDGRSDIYALGCVMYHSMTGKPPFVGDTAIDTIRLQISGIATPVDQARPDLYFPEKMLTVVNKALQKDPRARYQRMEQLKSDLQSCGRRSDTSITTSMRVSRVEQELAQTEAYEEPKTNMTLIYCMVAVLIGIAVAGVSLIIDAQQKDKPKFALATPKPLESLSPKHKPPPTVTPAAAPEQSIDDTQWRQALQAAQASFTAGQYREATKLYAEALEQASHFKSPDVRTAMTLSGLASVDYAQDKLEDAERYSKQALDIYNAAGSKDPARADVLANLAKISCAKNDDAQAQSYAEEALKIRQEALGPTHHDVAAAMQTLAAVACVRGDYKQADELLTKALAIAQKSLGEDNPDVSSIFHDLAMVREKEGKYDSAESLFNRALGIRQKYMGMEHPAVADTLCALGTLDFNVRKDAAAETMFNNALNIRLKAFGEDSSRTAEVYSCMAILYDDQKRFDKAEECYRKAVEIREKLWGEDSPKLVHSLQNLAKFLRKHNQANGAEVYEAQIKRIQDRNVSGKKASSIGYLHRTSSAYTG